MTKWEKTMMNKFYRRLKQSKEKRNQKNVHISEEVLRERAKVEHAGVKCKDLCTSL